MTLYFTLWINDFNQSCVSDYDLKLSVRAWWAIFEYTSEDNDCPSSRSHQYSTDQQGTVLTVSALLFHLWLMFDLGADLVQSTVSAMIIKPTMVVSFLWWLPYICCSYSGLSHTTTTSFSTIHWMKPLKKVQPPIVVLSSLSILLPGILSISTLNVAIYAASTNLMIKKYAIKYKVNKNLTLMHLPHIVGSHS